MRWAYDNTLLYTFGQFFVSFLYIKNFLAKKITAPGSKDLGALEYSSQKQNTGQHDERLVEHIDPNGFCAQIAQAGELYAPELLPWALAHEQAVELEAAEVQKHPWQDGKKIAGGKAGIGKAQRGKNPQRVHGPGQGKLKQAGDADIALIDMPEKQKQQKAERQRPADGELAAELFKREHQQNRAAEKVQDPKPNHLIGRNDKRCEADDKAESVYYKSPAQILRPAKGPDKAGDQDEGPADKLLPDVRPYPVIPAGVAPVDDANIVHRVKSHHVYNGYAAYAVDKIIPRFFLLHGAATSQDKLCADIITALKGMRNRKRGCSKQQILS